MKRSTICLTFCLAAHATLASLTSAHDSWVQTNTNLVRQGDVVHVDLMLGNHGNDHRDFKLASKLDPAGGTLVIVSPSGKSYDVKSQLADLGYGPKEGFWSMRFKTGEAGLHTVVHTVDRVVNHGTPVRSIKSGKCYFVASTSLDRPSPENPGFEKPLGHALELVPTASPVTPMGPGQPIAVKLLLKGQPLDGATVSFIPRGTELATGFDERYQRKTDAKGQASFTPTEGNYYLIVAHHLSPDETGADYESTKYTATLTVYVPEVCPCCGE
ncbi:MAG: DUF4198 domain-containing protein [Pirellulaceae bacterium]|jgi:uncharacterized GH25 family protein|nr:DUF4198 domain-containing protein [Pirellulaceae bacterium]